MNKIFKNKILIIMIVIGLSFSIGVGATTLYNAYQVEYNVSTDESISNVEQALNSLFQITSTSNSTPIILTRACWGELSSSITIEKTNKYKGILYYTTSNNGETTARNIYVKRNGTTIFTQSYLANYAPYLKSVNIGEIELTSGDILELSLSKEDNYSVEMLVLY